MNHSKLLPSDRPYERFVKQGAGTLSDAELLAIIIRTGTVDKDAMDIAADILSLGAGFGKGLIGLFDVSIEELLKIKGVGIVKAVKLKALAELSMRMHRECAKDGFNANDPGTVADYFMEDMRHLEYEQVVLAAIDSKGCLISHKIISSGSVNKSLLSPRTVFIESFRMKAVYIILLHNHPSGDPNPSDSDLSLTEVISELGDKLEIRLLDHIIIGDNCYYSFRENNLLDCSF